MGQGEGVIEPKLIPGPTKTRTFSPSPLHPPNPSSPPYSTYQPTRPRTAQQSSYPTLPPHSPERNHYPSLSLPPNGSDSPRRGVSVIVTRRGKFGMMISKLGLGDGVRTERTRIRRMLGLAKLKLVLVRHLTIFMIGS